MKLMRRFVLIIFALSLLLALLLAFDGIPFLRGGFGWQWPYQPAPLHRAAPLVALTAVYVAGAGGLLHRARRAAPLLLWCAVGCVALPLAALWLRSDDVLYTLFTRTVSAVTTGTHYAAAYEIDWAGGEWRDWSALVHDLQGRVGHVPVSPPGLPVFYGLLNQLMALLPAPLLTALQQPLLPYQCDNYTLLTYTPAQWASAWFGVLMPLWSALTLLPLWRAARRVVGDHARRVVVWFSLIPALVVFVPTWYMLFPLLSLLAFLLFEGALRRGSAGRMIAAGAWFGGLVFVNYAFIPLAALFGFYTLLADWQTRRSASLHLITAIVTGIQFGAGAALPWLAYWLVSGQSFWDVFSASFDLHLDLNRPYFPWLWLHFWDWVLWLGLPLLLLWLAGLWHWGQTWAQQAQYRTRQASSLQSRAAGGDKLSPHPNPPVVARSGTPLLSLSLLLTILLLLVSDASRGETGRVWMVFTPFALIAAVDGWRRLAGETTAQIHTDGRGSPRPYETHPGVGTTQASSEPVTAAPQFLPASPESVAAARQRSPVSFDFTGLLLLSGQAALMLVVAVTLAAIDAPDITPPPTPPGQAAAAQPADARFDGAFTLVGWDTAVEAGAIQLRLNWRTDAPLTIPYWFSALLVAPDGSTPLPAVVWQPLQTNYPTTCWRPGSIVGDTIVLPLPPDAPGGDWWISLAAFPDDAGLERLLVTLPDGAQDTQVGLGPVKN